MRPARRGACDSRSDFLRSGQHLQAASPTCKRRCAWPRAAPQQRCSAWQHLSSRPSWRPAWQLALSPTSIRSAHRSLTSACLRFGPFPHPAWPRRARSRAAPATPPGLLAERVDDLRADILGGARGLAQLRARAGALDEQVERPQSRVEQPRGALDIGEHPVAQLGAAQAGLDLADARLVGDFEQPRDRAARRSAARDRADRRRRGQRAPRWRRRRGGPGDPARQRAAPASRRPSQRTRA